VPEAQLPRPVGILVQQPQLGRDAQRGCDVLAVRRDEHVMVDRPTEQRRRLEDLSMVGAHAVEAGRDGVGDRHRQHRDGRRRDIHTRGGGRERAGRGQCADKFFDEERKTVGALDEQAGQHLRRRLTEMCLRELTRRVEVERA
jgi:hypothetical protein